jgi:hypothetical protein
MIVDSIWLSNNVKSADYSTCRKCGGEAKRIGSESIFSKYSGVNREIKRKADRL